LGAGLLDFLGAEESGVFDEAAEFFFADVMVRAFAIAKIVEGLVLHFQSFEVKDEKILVALIPDLALLQFHGIKLRGASGAGEVFSWGEIR
jgi:hypothetical protein